MSAGSQADRIELVPGWTLWPVAALRSAGRPFALLEHFATPDLLARPPGSERDDAIRRASAAAVRTALLDEGLREALTWQNPVLVDNWVGDYAARLVTDPQARLGDRAYRFHVVARYAQRYCAKNESIGFFGPVAWARLVPGGSGLEVTGTGGLRRTSVHLETWSVRALADAWRADTGVLEHLPVHLDAATTLRDGLLWRPRRPPAACDPDAAPLLAAVDGRRTVADVVAVAVAAGAGDAPGLRARLLALHDQGVVHVGFRVPHHERPEDLLRSQLEGIADAAVRDDLLARLDQVVAARDAVPVGEGSARVRPALAEASRQLAKAGGTGVVDARLSVYARTPLYADARRDTDVRLGGDLLDALREPLGIMLGSARWLAAEVADALAEQMLQRYRRLAARRPIVTLADLQFAVGDLLSPSGPVADEVLRDFQLRWAEIFSALGRPVNGAVNGPSGGGAPGTPPGSTVSLDSAAVRPLAEALFPPRAPRWAAARQHSPDVMLRRRRDGGLQWVLGELHVALNTLESRFFRSQSDDPDELVALTREDFPAGRVVPLYPIDAVEATARTYPPSALDPPGHYRYWSFGGDDGHPDAVHAVPATSVLVEERDGDLVGVPRELGWEAPVLEFFGDFVTATAVNLFRLRPRARYLPRVLLDDVVVCRRSWSIPVHEAPVPPPGRPLRDRGHEEVRAWAAGLGMPRHVFVRSPGQRKPWYVDLCSPLLVGNLVRALRRPLPENASQDGQEAFLDVVEMLPRPQELWLTDADGAECTSEFRMVAVDDHPAPPPLRPHPGPRAT